MKLCPTNLAGIGKTEPNKHVTPKESKIYVQPSYSTPETNKKLNIKISSHLHFHNTGGHQNSVKMYNNSRNHKQPQSCNSSRR
jgi:hypothetical protein